MSCLIKGIPRWRCRIDLLQPTEKILQVLRRLWNSGKGSRGTVAAEKPVLAGLFLKLARPHSAYEASENIFRLNIVERENAKSTRPGVPNEIGSSLARDLGKRRQELR